MSVEQIIKPGKAHGAYLQLKHEIESGVLKPGESLSESELVGRTGASRTPVREAVRRLASEGLIILEPRRAPMVSRISIAGARALFEFRRLIEPAAAASVARSIVGGQEKIADAFRALRERFEALHERPVSNEFEVDFAELTSRFDSLLNDFVPNEHLSRSIAELRPHTRRLRTIAHADYARLHDSIQEHIEMCDALAAGDDQRASAAMTQHLFHVEKSVFKHLLGTSSDGLDGIELG